MCDEYNVPDAREENITLHGAHLLRNTAVKHVDNLQMAPSRAEHM